MIRVSSGRLAVISVLGATCLWGTSGPAMALAASGANPAAVGAARLLLGGLVLGAVALSSGAPVRTWLCGRDWRWLVLAAVSTGCALLLLPDGRTGVDPLGVVLALIAAGCYGGYTVAAKQLVRTGHPIERVIAASLLGGGLALAPAFTVHASGLLSAHGILLVLWLGLACTTLAYVLFVRALRDVPAATAGTLSLAEPLVAVTVSAVVLGDRLAALTIVGGSLLLAGIAFASLPSPRRPAPIGALAEAAS